MHRLWLAGEIRIGKSTHDNVEPLITIGHSPYLDPVLISSLLAVHLPLYPGLRLRMESMFSADLAHGVLTAELDLAIINELSENTLLTLVPLISAPLCVVMPADHPSAPELHVSIESFSNTGWMIFPRRAHPVIYERVMDAARISDTSPVEIHHYINPEETIELIRENFGVAFVAKGVADKLRAQDIVVRPLRLDPLHITSYLVLRADQSSRLINDFGRAFLRKIGKNSPFNDGTGQLLLRL